MEELKQNCKQDDYPGEDNFFSKVDIKNLFGQS